MLERDEMATFVPSADAQLIIQVAHRQAALCRLGCCDGDQAEDFELLELYIHLAAGDGFELC